MDPVTMSAIIGAAGKIGSSMINKEAAEEKGIAGMFQSTDPMRYLQGLNMNFTVPGMEGVNNLLKR